MSSTSFEFWTFLKIKKREPIIEAWTHLTEKWRYRWKVIQPWLKQKRNFAVCLLMMYEPLSFFGESYRNYLKQSQQSNCKVGAINTLGCFGNLNSRQLGEDGRQRMAEDGGGILQKQITLMTCNCGASQVIRLDYALINSMSDPLQQASKDHIIIPLLI